MSDERRASAGTGAAAEASRSVRSPMHECRASAAAAAAAAVTAEAGRSVRRPSVPVLAMSGGLYRTEGMCCPRVLS